MCKKERGLVNKVNVELIEKVICQQILYYPVDLEATNVHGLYGEAIAKTYLPPVRIYALIVFNEEATPYLPNVVVDSDSPITILFHKIIRTEDQDLYVRDGDFIPYVKIYYETVTLSEPRKLFGQVNHSFEIAGTCLRARRGLCDAT